MRAGVEKGDGLERRLANAKDASRIVGWFADRAAAITWGGPQVAEPFTPDWLTQEFQDGSYWVWIDPHGDLMGISRLVNPELGAFHIMRFAVAPAFRGRGLGKILIEDIAKMVAALGGQRLTLNVYGSNAIARRLYLSAGFKVVGERSATEDPSGVSVKMAYAL